MCTTQGEAVHAVCDLAGEQPALVPILCWRPFVDLGATPQDTGRVWLRWTKPLTPAPPLKELANLSDYASRIPLKSTHLFHLSIASDCVVRVVSCTLDSGNIATLFMRVVLCKPNRAGSMMSISNPNESMGPGFCLD